VLKKLFRHGAASYGAVSKQRLQVHWLPDRASFDVVALEVLTHVRRNDPEAIVIEQDASQPACRAASWYPANMRKAELESRIAGIRSFGHRESLILNSCRGRSVLDVGCLGQPRNHDSEHWLPGELRKVASNLMGVDINRAGFVLAVGALAQRARPYVAEDVFVELAAPSVRAEA
jgi:hypothetical protein